jgi:hypothetical protein
VSGPEYRAAIHLAFDSILGADGFVRAGDMKWVRSRGPVIRDVILVYALKGGMYTTRWGVSLDFVPHITNDVLRWHRSPTSARIDLGYDPLDFIDGRIGAFNARPPTDDPAFEPLSLVDPAQARTSWWEISAWRPPSDGPGEQTRAAKQVMAMSTPWLAAIRDLNSLLAAFEREQRRPSNRFPFDAYVQHRLAYAFALAAANETSKALVELRRWADDYEPAEGVRATLYELVRTGVTFAHAE